MIYNKRPFMVFIRFVHSDEFRVDKFYGINGGKLFFLMIFNI